MSPNKLLPLKWSLFSVTLLASTVAKETAEESFKECLISRPTEAFGYCLGVGAVTKLKTLEDDPQFDVADGFTFTRDEQRYREGHNFIDSSDPGSFRSIVDSMEHVFSRRNLHWNMGVLYPGLSMRVSPSLGTGGLLEFALDQHRDFLAQQNLKEVSTGRVLARQFIVPFLLGFKFNIATLIPIIFGAVALLAKKAIIISKLALIITTAYALSNMVFSYGSNSFHQPNYQHYPNSEHLGAHYYRYKDEDSDYYRNNQNGFSDQIKLHGQIPVEEVFAREDKTKGRNFAWSSDEIKSKT